MPQAGKARHEVGDRGERRAWPDPDAHHESLEQATLRPPATITLVDDVITRGSTFFAMYQQRLAEAFPQAEIRCFAVVRTMSGVEVDPIMSPVEGLIAFDGTDPQRRP